MAENEHNFCPKLTPDKRCKLISDMSRPQNAGTLPVPSVCASPTRCALYVASMEAEVARYRAIKSDLVQSFGTPELIAWADRLEAFAEVEYLLSALEAMQEIDGGADSWPRWEDLPEWKKDDCRARAKRVVYEREKARAALPRKSHRWIPVSEDDPEEDMLVFVANMDASFKSITIGMFNGQRWRTWNGVGIYVTHWMSLPFPDWPEEGAAAPEEGE